MPIQAINLGTTPRDGTGDDLRAAGLKINANLATLEARADAAGILTDQIALRSDATAALVDTTAALADVTAALADATVARVDAVETRADEIAAESALATTALQPGDIADVLRSTPGATGGGSIANVIRVTQAQYDAIAVPDAGTLYVIEG